MNMLDNNKKTDVWRARQASTHQLVVILRNIVATISLKLGMISSNEKKKLLEVANLNRPPPVKMFL